MFIKLISWRDKTLSKHTWTKRMFENPVAHNSNRTPKNSRGTHFTPPPPPTKVPVLLIFCSPEI